MEEIKSILARMKERLGQTVPGNNARGENATDYLRKLQQDRPALRSVCPLCEGHGWYEQVDSERKAVVLAIKDGKGEERRPQQVVAYRHKVVCACLLAQAPQALESAGLEGRLSTKRIGQLGPGLDTFDPSEMDPDEWASVESWKAGLPGSVTRDDCPYGLLLAGNINGNGKTMVAAALGHAALAAGVRVLFVTEGDLLERFRASYDDGSRETPQQVLAAVRSIPLLIIDDVGSSYARDSPQVSWYEDKLFAIIDARQQETGRPVIITTNLAPHDLEERLGRRTASRLHLLWVVGFRGRDRRGE